MTLDNVCEHTAGIADDALHQHYSELINNAGIILYGRVTYQLMQYWQSVLQDPAEEKAMNEFAISIDKIPKLVFSKSLQESGWRSAQITEKSPEEEVMQLKQQPGRDILVGSRSLIIQLLNSKLIDELQICIHPVIESKGMLLFDRIKERIMLKHLQTKLLPSGAVLLYYEPAQTS